MQMPILLAVQYYTTHHRLLFPILRLLTDNHSSIDGRNVNTSNCLINSMCCANSGDNIKDQSRMYQCSHVVFTDGSHAVPELRTRDMILARAKQNFLAKCTAAAISLVECENWRDYPC